MAAGLVAASLWFVLMCFVLALGIWFGHCSLTHFSKQINVVPLIPFGPFVIGHNTCNAEPEPNSFSFVFVHSFFFFLLLSSGEKFDPI